MKEIINGYGSNYDIQSIELGNIKNDFYLKFNFSDEIKADDFKTYLKMRLIILANDAEEEIYFKQLNHNNNSKTSVEIIGNISQAVNFFKVDNLFSKQLKEILDDSGETEIQKILKASKKCTEFLLTTPVEPCYKVDFFNPKVNKIKEDNNTFKSTIKNIICIK